MVVELLSSDHLSCCRPGRLQDVMLTECFTRLYFQQNLHQAKEL